MLSRVDRLKCSAAPVICVMEHLQSKVGRDCGTICSFYSHFALQPGIETWWSCSGLTEFCHSPSRIGCFQSSGNSSIGAENFGWSSGISWISATSLCAFWRYHVQSVIAYVVMQAPYNLHFVLAKFGSSQKNLASWNSKVLFVSSHRVCIVLNWLECREFWLQYPLLLSPCHSETVAMLWTVAVCLR